MTVLLYAPLILAGKIFPGSEEDIFSLLGSAGYDHFPHPGSYDQDRRIFKDQVFVRRDVRRRICGDDDWGSRTLFVIMEAERNEDKSRPIKTVNSMFIISYLLRFACVLFSVDILL